MKNIKKIFLSVFLMSLLFTYIGCGAASTGKSNAGLKVADAYGVNQFNKIEAIKYTFNVMKGDKTASRSWIWKPKSSTVTLIRKDGKSLSYNRSKLKNEKKDVQKIDPMFINDNYWFLFPFRLKWDSVIKVSDKGTKESPIGKSKSKQLIVQYPNVGGYTPGDIYELFIGKNNQIIEWIYRKGGSPKPSRIATWEDHKQLGPIKVSLNHYDAEKKFRVWFTDVAVKVSGSKDWIEAK